MADDQEHLDIETLSVLVVDDMKSMRLTIRKMLKNLHRGMTLRFAENGRQGLEVLKSTPCDLAILDWNMPVMNGVAMLEVIRNDPRMRDMPVIMVTAESERDIVNEVAEVEIDGYLLKPLTLKSLDDKIKTVINRANHPDPVTVHKRKARDLEEEGDIQGAIDEIRAALTHKPSASRLLRTLGLLHFRIKKNGVAVKCLQKAVAVNNQDIISRVYLGDYYLKRNDLEQAAKYYLEIMRLSTRYNDRAFGIGEQLLQNGYRQLAIDVFSKVLVRSKKQNAARERIIDICLSYQEYDFPEKLLKQCIKENPSNYDMVYKAGLISLDAGDLDTALKHFIEVDRHVRSHIDAKFNIAKIYYQNRKVLQADDYLTQILRIEPDNKDALALRKEI